MKQFTSPEIAKAFVLTSFLMLSVIAAPAQAVVIDFESLAVNNAAINSVDSPYTEDGFTVANNVASFVPLSFYGTQSSSYPGSTALFKILGDGVIILNQVGGGAFTLSSIDLANLNNLATPTPVTFYGSKADNSTVSQTFTSNAVGLTTFSFTNFTNLVVVRWFQYSSPSHQFDNINVSAASTTDVPEPFTVLGTIFGAGYGVALKRKLAKAKLEQEDIS